MVWLATIVLLIRSLFAEDQFFYKNPAYRECGFRSDSASIVIYSSHYFVYEPFQYGPEPIRYREHENLPAPLNFISYQIFDPGPLNFGFHFAPWLYYGDWSKRPLARSWNLTIPDWPILILTAIIPLLWWRRTHTHRQPPGICPQCGYDLRATPTQCPECGSIRSPAPNPT